MTRSDHASSFPKAKASPIGFTPCTNAPWAAVSRRRDTRMSYRRRTRVQITRGNAASSIPGEKTSPRFTDAQHSRDAYSKFLNASPRKSASQRFRKLTQLGLDLTFEVCEGLASLHRSSAPPGFFDNFCRVEIGRDLLHAAQHRPVQRVRNSQPRRRHGHSSLICTGGETACRGFCYPGLPPPAMQGRVQRNRRRCLYARKRGRGREFRSGDAGPYCSAASTTQLRRMIRA